MARVSVDGVIASIRKALGTARKSSFSLEDVDDCYRYFAGEPVPYRDCGAASLLELLQKKCDFLTVMKTDGQTVEVVLRPFPYEDARVNRKIQPASDELFDQVHNELSPSFVRYLKMFINKMGQNGVTIAEFEEQLNRESHKPLNYKGFSKEKFFRGLSDVFDVRKENGMLKLYPVRDVEPVNNKTHKTQSSQQDHNELVAKVAKIIPTKFQDVLSHKIQECTMKAKDGVTIDEFRAYFNATSPTRLHFSGLSEDEFFRGLPHIFRLEVCGETVKLFPATAGKAGLANHNSSAKVVSTRFSSIARRDYAKESAQGNRSKSENKKAQQQATDQQQKYQIRQVSRGEVNARGGPMKTISAKMKTLCDGQQLWIVHYDNSGDFVPTGCIAQLAGLPSDTVELELRRMYLKPSIYKKLEDDNVKVTLVRNGVADADVTMYPLQSCPAIVRVIMGERTNETLIRDIINYIEN